MYFGDTCKSHCEGSENDGRVGEKYRCLDVVSSCVHRPGALHVIILCHGIRVRTASTLSNIIFGRMRYVHTVSKSTRARQQMLLKNTSHPANIEIAVLKLKMQCTPPILQHSS